MFALLNKYSKILEIPKSHLRIPVQCTQSNYVNTVASHVNSKETVFIYQDRNTGPQKSKLSRDAVLCWGLWGSARMPWSLRTLIFAGFSVPQRRGEPNCLVNLPISLMVQQPRPEITVNNRKKQMRGKSWAPNTAQQVSIQIRRLFRGSCCGVLVQLPCSLFGSKLLLQIIEGNALFWHLFDMFWDRLSAIAGEGCAELRTEGKNKPFTIFRGYFGRIQTWNRDRCCLPPGLDR